MLVDHEACLLCDTTDMTPLLATQHHRFVSQEGGTRPPPSTQNHAVVSQTKLWTLVYDLLLDLDTCLAPEAQKWTDFNYSLKLSDWDGSGSKFEGSAPKFKEKSKK